MAGGLPLRVIHTPFNIAGQSASLAAAERRLGLDSRNVVLFETGKGFPADEALVACESDLMAVERARWTLLRRAMRADVVHYSFGRSILMPNVYPDCSGLLGLPPWRWPRRLYARALWFKDARLLKAMGKSIVVTWQGDDARQGDVLRRLGRDSVADAAGYYSDVTDRWKRRTIAMWAALADRQYFLNPDLGHVLPPDARFLPYASVDPASIGSLQLAGADRNRPLSIVHAPTHRGVKGTQHVLDAIAALTASRADIRFRTIEAMSRAEALAAYRDADIVIDQLMIGWYGGLAVEAMALGKVVLCHINPDDLAFVPSELAANLPVIRADHLNLLDVLQQLAARPRADLAAIGAAGRAFVERWHNPETIASAVVADYAEIARRT